MSNPEQVPRRSPYVRRPGDRVVRRAVPKSETFEIRAPRIRRNRRNPALVLVFGFVGLIVLGALLLLLPMSSEGARATDPITALFTATSAVCVTGLVVVDTQTHWSSFGEAVILILIQLGGFGFMTSSTLMLMLAGRRATLRDRTILREAMGGGALGETMVVVRRVALFTLLTELVGTLLLLPRFLAEEGPGRAVWWSLFHSVSAFNNAGFDLLGDFRSLIGFQRDAWVLSVIGGLIVLGGLGYTVVADVAERRSWRRLLVDSKLVLATTGALLATGTVLFLAMEAANPDTLGPMSWPAKVLNAGFQSVTSRTAGYNSINIAEMREQSLFLTMALMFIGGASGSTAGGIKVQTFSLLFFAIVASVRGSEHVVAFGREAPQAQVYRAISVALLAIAVVFSVALGLAVFESVIFVRVLFESVSAFGTVGLSTGVTPELSIQGRVIVMATMFIGRLGPLTLVLALAARANRRTFRHATESVKIG